MKNDTADKTINISVDKLHDLRQELIYDIAVLERERLSNSEPQSDTGLWLQNSFGTGFWWGVFALIAFCCFAAAGVITDLNDMVFITIAIAMLLETGIEGTSRKIDALNDRKENIDSILRAKIRNTRVYLEYVDDILLESGEIHNNTDDEINRCIASINKDR